MRDVDVKYIDPSYMIRSVKPIATDAVYVRKTPLILHVFLHNPPPRAQQCKLLAHAAVHAAFSGFTGTTVGLVNTRYVLLPSSAVIKSPRIVDPNGQLWARLVCATMRSVLCGIWNVQPSHVTPRHTTQRGSIGQPDLI